MLYKNFIFTRGLRVLSLPASVRPSVCPSITKFVRAITHHPFKLGSPNFDHRCKRPWLTYCNHVWGNACMSTLNPLVLLQKRIIRIISGSKRLSHTDPLFKELGLLKLKDVNKFVIGKFMFRWYHDEVPSIFHDYFDYVKNVHNHDTRQKDHLYIPIVRSERGKTKITYRGPEIWNQIQVASIDPVTSEAVFSKTLKQSIKMSLVWFFP